MQALFAPASERNPRVFPSVGPKLLQGGLLMSEPHSGGGRRGRQGVTDTDFLTLPVDPHGAFRCWKWLRLSCSLIF